MKYLIYGAKDFALVLKDHLDYHQMPFAGYIDDFSAADDIIGSFSEIKKRYSPDEYQIVLGIGYANLSARQEIFQRLKRSGYTVATLIHDHAYVRNKDKIGEGCIVMAHACVDSNAVIDEAVVLWPGVVVNHDSRVGSNSFLSPNATVCGFVTIGPNSFIGAGSVIADHQEVPPNHFVKAGAVYAANSLPAKRLDDLERNPS